jgi:hypothetical protein
MADHCYDDCRYAECRYAECHYAGCRYAECHYAECHYAECRGAVNRVSSGSSTVVKHSTHHPRVKGLNPAAGTAKKRPHF